MAEYFKGFFPGWSHSANPSWASVSENGSNSPQWVTFSMGHAGASRKSPNDAPWETLSLRLSRPISVPFLTVARSWRHEKKVHIIGITCSYTSHVSITYRKQLTTSAPKGGRKRVGMRASLRRKQRCQHILTHNAQKPTGRPPAGLKPAEYLIIKADRALSWRFDYLWWLPAEKCEQNNTVKNGMYVQ